MLCDAVATAMEALMSYGESRELSREEVEHALLHGLSRLNHGWVSCTSEHELGASPEAGALDLKVARDGA